METLKKVLLVNATSSGATGILLSAIPQTIAQLFNSPVSWPFIEAGVFLIAFALFILYTVWQKALNTVLIRLIIMLDALWATLSILLIITGAFNLSGIGYLLIGAVAGWVALMAYLQTRFLNKALPTEPAL